MCTNKAQFFASFEMEIGYHYLQSLESYTLEDPEMIPALFLYDFEWGFQKLLEHYQEDVFYAAKRIVYNPVLTEEVAQEVWIKAHHFFKMHASHVHLTLRKTRSSTPRLITWANWISFDFEAWLEKVAHNIACDVWKKEHKQQCFPIDVELFQIESDRIDRPDIQLIREESLHEIRDLVNTLPSKYARVMRLRFFGAGQDDLMRFEEIAQHLKLPVGTVRVQAKRALTQFRRAFEARQTGLHELELLV